LEVFPSSATSRRRLEENSEEYNDFSIAVERWITQIGKRRLVSGEQFGIELMAFDITAMYGNNLKVQWT
jgi:hypothetical protein